MSWAEKLGLNAFKLLGNYKMLIFFCFQCFWEQPCS
ncbi:hypothetical protein KRR40_06475 [Niabella defluvii]|nr:hypothetical protein KRR40_06475 [Niabella sp. I65]